LPLLFYLKLFSKEIVGFERAGIYALLAISTILSIVGTVFSFLPRSMLGVE
jgi:vesicular inhibitory amino acid transporter